MKTKLSLLALGLAGMVSFANAFSGTSVKTEINVLTTDLSQIYGKKLNVAWHKKNNLKVGHKGTDYILLKKDGKYEQQWSGIPGKGTWKYDADNNKLTINCVGSNTYSVKEVSAEKLILTRHKEYISFVAKPAKPEVSPKPKPVKPKPKPVKPQVKPNKPQVKPMKPGKPVAAAVPFKAHLGKKMNVAWHKKNNLKVGHKGTDFIKLNADGSYEQQWSGIPGKGTWKYDSESNKLTINCVGSNTYVVKEVTEEKLILTRHKEYLSFMVSKNQ